MLYAIANRQAKERRRLTPITFQPVNWQPQVEVTFNRDVNGWLDHDRSIKFHFAAGSTHMIDAEHAIEFVCKGYATGKLPRRVSQDEIDEYRSQVTVLSLASHDAAPPTPNGRP